MSKDWNPKLPEFRKTLCVICNEEITAPPFIASRLRRGPTVYAHTECVKTERKDNKTND